MSKQLLPPPIRLPSSSTSSSPSASRSPSPKPRSGKWKVFEKKLTVAGDWVGGKMNTLADKVGSEHFTPVTGDFPLEMEKAARILRAFTETTLEDQKLESKQKKVHLKIPASVVREAVGLCIFTCMRSGAAPFGGSGGSGLIVAKLADGSWSAPSSVSPNNLSTGFMIGIDIYDAVLVIRTPQALASFASTFKGTLGSDVAVVAGPYGAGGAAEIGRDRAPIFSYVRSRGFFAGVQLVGQVFIARKEENEAMYQWPGITPGDILAGKVRVPSQANTLVAALIDAESGRAQDLKPFFNEP